MSYPSYSYLNTRASRAPFRRAAHLQVQPWMGYLLIAGLVSLFLFPLMLLGGLIGFYSLTGQVYPGIHAAGIPAGGQTRDALAEQIDEDFNHQPRLVLTDGQRSWPAIPAEIGVTLDAQAMSAQAYAVGRGAQAIQEILWLARFQGIEVKPVVAFDPHLTRAQLEQLAVEINVPAREAALVFENGQWGAAPGSSGSLVDVDATLQKIAADPQAVLSTGYVPLVVRAVHPAVADLSPLLDQLRSDLARPLRLRAYDPITDETLEWEVPRETFAGWVSVSQQQGRLSYSIDSRHLDAYLQEWQAAAGGSRVLDPYRLPGDVAPMWQAGQPLDLTLQHSPTSYTVQPGDTLTRIAFQVGMPYWKIQQANPGIDLDALVAGQSLTIPSKNEMLPLPVVRGKRIVISISQQQMWTFENDSLRSEHVISTGIDRSPTIPGVYQVQTHEVEAYASVWDLTMPHFMGIYEGWPGFMNGIHGLPTLSSGRQLWAGALGRPVSYGCIILDLDTAEDLFSWAEAGVVVEIQP